MFDNPTSSMMRGLNALFDKHDPFNSVLDSIGLTPEQVRRSLGTPKQRIEAITPKNQECKVNWDNRKLVLGLLKSKSGEWMLAGKIGLELDMSGQTVGNLLRNLSEEYPEIEREGGKRGTFWRWNK